MSSNVADAETERILSEGKAAARRGDKQSARELLTKAVERDPRNEQAWMWLSGVVATPEEQRICLENVLVINPYNVQARKGLEYLNSKNGAPAASAPEVPASPVQEAPPPSPSAPGPDDRHMAGPFAASGPEVFGSVPPWAQDEASPQLDQGTAFLPQQFHPNSDTAPTSASAAHEQPAGGAEWAAPSASADAGPYANFSASAQGLSSIPVWEQPGLGLGAAPSFERAEPSRSPQPESAPPSGYASSGGFGAFGGFGQEPSAAPAADQSWSAGAPVEPEPAPQPFSYDQFSFAAPAGAAQGPPAGQPGPEADPFWGMPAGPASADASGGASPFGLAPMGPYSDAQLPSPADLPVPAGEASGSAQPWYLSSSSSGSQASAPTREAETPSYIPSPEDSGGLAGAAASGAPAAEVATIPCPNCREQVAETALACPNCRYNFFATCPHCHELVDVSDAKPDEKTPCPYCNGPIAKLELGLLTSDRTASKRAAAAAKEALVQYPTAADAAQPRPVGARAGQGLRWVFDLAWLAALIFAIWALTQLPTWLGLTGLY